MDILLSMDVLVFDVHLLHDPLSSPSLSLSPIHHRIALLYHSPHLSSSYSFLTSI